MQSTRSIQGHAGFTLIELMIVIAIIGIVSMMVAPNFTRYGIREDARSNAEAISRVLATTRQRAIDTGISHFVIFDNPIQLSTPGTNTPQIATIVRDMDGNWSFGQEDTSEPFYASENSHPNVAVIDGTAPFLGYDLPPEDQVAANSAAINTLADVTGNGTTFPNAPFNFNPTIGFNTQGIPVDLNTPTQWGSGAGAVYLTDGDASVYSVILLPLGATRVRVLNTAAAPPAWQ